MTVLTASDDVEGRSVAVVEYAARKHVFFQIAVCIICGGRGWGEGGGGEGERTDYQENGRNRGVKSVIRYSRVMALRILENVSTCYVKIARGLTWLASDPV